MTSISHITLLRRFVTGCGLVLVLALATFKAVVSHGQAADHRTQPLTFEDRVAAQRAIEAVYHRHRIWPKDNPQPKPTLNEVLPEAALRTKVEDYLRQSNALERYWQQPLTAEQLQAELERMAQNTRQPEVLRELWAALGDDPLVIAECLARPALTERSSREWYASDERFHGALKQQVGLGLDQLRTGGQPRHTSGEYREVEWRMDESDLARLSRGLEINGILRLDAARWQEQVRGLTETFGSAGTTTDLPVGRWSDLQEDEERFYAVAILEKSARWLKVANVVWRKTPFDQWWNEARQGLSLDVEASAFVFRLPQGAAVPGQCAGEAWTATSASGGPAARNGHAAVWTGSEMIVWGGLDGISFFNSGGRYNPALDTWTPTGTTNAPTARAAPTGIWTGTEMIVWGGNSDGPTSIGGRYNPATNSWVLTSDTGSPSSRVFHTGVWTGSEMIIWGGLSGSTSLTTGGRYNPASNSWMPTTTTNVPVTRLFHTAVWTGAEMIIWGGLTATGGRYDPVSDSWTATSLTDAPASRFIHSAVWTGNRMIVWGGSGDLNTGGQYNPATNSWAATSTTNSPTPRRNHTVVWTGSEMIVWGGQAGTSPNTTELNSGGRYNPDTNTWTATSAANAPSVRYSQIAVWAGNQMIVWGGLVGGGATLTRLNTGGRYILAGALSISPTNQSFPAGGGNGSVSISASGSCSWTVTSNASSIAITSGSSGSGNGTVNFTVAANTSASSRNGTLTIGTQTFTVTQAGAAPVAVSLSTALTGALGANLAVPILVGELTGKAVVAYDFILTFDPNVLQLQSTPTDATGTLSSGFSVTPNATTPGQLRVSAFGTTALAGAGTLLKLNFNVTGQPSSSTALTWQSFRFNEGTPAVATTNGRFMASGNLPPTLTGLSPSTAIVGSAGFTLTVNGTGFVNGAVVRWNNSDRATTFISGTQLTATIPASDLANAGTINVTAVNPGSAASNARPFTITCSYTLAPTTQSFSSASNTGTVTVMTGANCPWTASSNASWITVNTGASGTGNGTVNYTVAANTGAARTGTITIAGQTFTVNQAANVCAGLTLTLAPATLPDGTGSTAYNQTLTANGGTAQYSFAVSAGALPGGLTLSTSGTLSGTPNVAGTFNFTVTATDANGCTSTRSFTVNITVTLGAQTRALYVLNDNASGNQIYGYAVNETTGALTLLIGFPISTGGNGTENFLASERLTVDRANQRLYAINNGSDTISAYAINPTTGTLITLPFSPINLSSGDWSTITVHPSGSPLVVGNSSSQVASYQITATTATAAAGSPYVTGTNSASTSFSQDGNYVYTGGNSLSTFSGFSVNAASGVLVALGGSPFNSIANFPVAYATDAVGRLFVANPTQVRVFTTTSGIPGAVSGNPFTSGLTQGSHGLLHPNGFYLVADRSGNRVGVFQINGSNSATTLTSVTGSPFAAGGTATDVLALNQAGTFLFAANGESRNLTTFSVNPSTGALTSPSAQPANTLGTSGRLTGMAYFSTPCSAITLSPATLLGGTVNTAYNQTIAASPSGNYNYSVTAGVLPTGLSLNASTGAITGTPTTAGTANFTITALSFGPCSGSQAHSLTINNPSPTLTSLSSPSVTAGSAGFTLTVNGTDFVNGSVVRWNNADRPTTFVSNTQLTAQIPASDLLTLGAARVTVFNPVPGGGVSTAASFTVNSSLASVSAASYGGVELAADSIVAAFGAGLATQTLAASVLPLPTTLAGTTIRVKDSTGVERNAPLFFVSPSQINYLVPTGTAAGAGVVTVTNGDGKLSLGPMQIALVAPGLFAANANGQGVAAALALRVKADGTQSYEAIARFDTATQRFVSTPIDLGPVGEQVFLILFGTGARFNSGLANAACQLGGTSAPVLYAGAQGELVGLDQVNVAVPRALIGRGEIDIVLMVDGKTANTVRVNFK